MFKALLAILPLVTTGLAVIGFIHEAYKYNQNQRSETFLSANKEIRSFTQDLIELPGDAKKPLASVTFLLQTIDENLETLHNKGLMTPKEVDERKNRIGELLIQVLTRDCDMSRNRDVIYANRVITKWKAVKDLFKGEDRREDRREEYQQDLTNVLSKLSEGLRRLYDKDSDLVSVITYSGGGYDFPKGTKVTSLQDHFVNLSETYKVYLDLVKDDAMRNWFIGAYNGATCNDILTKGLFKQSCTPLIDKELETEFILCPKRIHK